MHLFIQAACIVAVLNLAAAAGLPDQCATALTFNGVHFLTEILVKGSVGPLDLSVHDKTGDIFYIDSSKLYVLKDGSGEPQEIKGAEGVPHTIAVDNDHNEVGFSIGDKLYTYNRDTNTAVAHDKDTKKHDPIVHTFFTKNARYASTGDKLFKVTRSEKVELDSELYNGDNLVVDSKDNFFFIGKDGFPYVTPKGATKKTKLEIPGFEKTDLTLFSIDRLDNVFLNVNKRVYSVKADNNTPQLIGDYEKTQEIIPTSITHDKFNNAIVGTKGSITKYVKIDC